MKRLTCCFLMILGGLVSAGTGPDPEKDPHMNQLLQDAVNLIKNKSAPDAIPKCDTVINAYKTHYEGEKRRIYCARSSAQSLGSLIQTGLDDKSALVLSPAWAEAYFLKSFALQELHRPNEAKEALMAAIVLSPFDSHYFNELAEIYAHEKNWVKSADLFARAEDYANAAPDMNRPEELARARRGLGYVLVELGKLDEAERKYEECLAANPNDEKAKAELAWVREQKQKQTEKRKGH